jgi:hypothetical protein
VPCRAFSVLLSVTLFGTEYHVTLGGEDTLQPRGEAETVPYRESWITFLSHRTGHNVLYKMRPDGSELTPIFGGELRGVPVFEEGVTLYREPHWTRQSPNGKWFASWAFDSGRRDSDYRASTPSIIYTGSLDRSWTRVLAGNVTHRDEVLTWSPDSTRIAHTITSGMDGFQGYLRSEPKLRSTEIVIVRVDGLSEDYVFEQPGAWAVCDWSPDGGSLLLLHTLGDETQERAQRATELLEFHLVLARAAGALPPGCSPAPLPAGPPPAWARVVLLPLRHVGHSFREKDHFTLLPGVRHA